MERIGILTGEQKGLARDLVQLVNKDKNCKAEQIDLKKVFDGDSKYDLIVDLVSKDLPFYESYIKTAALNGTRVLQDPFQEVVQDRFFNINLAADLRLDTPKAALIPAKNQEDGLAENMNWESIFKYVGFPALLRPVYGVEEQPKQKIDNADEFREFYNASGNKVLVLEEMVNATNYFRCYIGGKVCEIVEFSLRDNNKKVKNAKPANKIVRQTIERGAKKMSKALDIQACYVDFVVGKEGRPYFVNFQSLIELNPTGTGKKVYKELLSLATKMIVGAATKKSRDSWEELVESELKSKKLVAKNSGIKSLGSKKKKEDDKSKKDANKVKAISKKSNKAKKTIKKVVDGIQKSNNLEENKKAFAKRLKKTKSTIQSVMAMAVNAKPSKKKTKGSSKIKSSKMKSQATKIKVGVVAALSPKNAESVKAKAPKMEMPKTPSKTTSLAAQDKKTAKAAAKKVASKTVKKSKVGKTTKSASATKTVSKGKVGRPVKSATSSTAKRTVTKGKVGRPSKSTTTTSKVSVTKRGPGRPKATTSKTTTTLVKGKVGRPSKSASATKTVSKGKVGRPVKSATSSTAKRTITKGKVGRPSKSTNTSKVSVVKRGVGRPKAISTAQKTSLTAKRGPGRPKATTTASKSTATKTTKTAAKTVARKSTAKTASTRKMAATKRTATKSTTSKTVAAKTDAKTTAALKFASDAGKRLDITRLGKYKASEKDDLTQISGIGAFVERKLNAMKIYRFEQIAKFNANDIEIVNEGIALFNGKVLRENWKQQAKDLLAAKK